MILANYAYLGIQFEADEDLQDPFCNHIYPIGIAILL